MKIYRDLPNGYNKTLSIDMHEQKTVFFTTMLSFIVFVAMVVPMLFIVPIQTMFNFNDGLVNGLIGIMKQLIILIVALLANSVILTLIAGLTVKICGGRNIKFALSGFYLFVEHSGYSDRSFYILTTLAPAILLAFALGATTAIVPANWFWVAYPVLALHISTIAVNFYISVKLLFMPSGILLKDNKAIIDVFQKH